jgi:hypothetical protein
MKSTIALLRELCNRNGRLCVYVTLGVTIGANLREIGDYLIVAFIRLH